MMSTFLNFGRDVQGYNAYAPPTAKDKWSATIPSGSESSITVPSNYQNWIVIFGIQPGAIIWVDLTGATADAPASATFVSDTTELNPGQRMVLAGSKISCFNGGLEPADVGIILYAVS